MDAADHRIDYLSCAHGPRYDLVHGYSLRKGEASNRVPLFSNPTVPVTPCLAPCDEERSSPAAQAQWRRNVTGKSIALTEQQVTAGYQSRSCHYCVKHYIEGIFPYLFVHDLVYFNSFATFQLQR